MRRIFRSRETISVYTPHFNVDVDATKFAYMYWRSVVVLQKWSEYVDHMWSYGQKCTFFWHFAIQVRKSKTALFPWNSIFSWLNIPQKVLNILVFASMQSLCIHDQHIEKWNGSKQYISQDQETQLVIFAKFFTKLWHFCVHQKCQNLTH